MNTKNRWLLPKGVEEILPKEAWLIKQYEKTLLNLYHAWGYELVIPPLMEYQESLLAGIGQDVDLLSFKVIDQLSGRTLAIRADITPQVARIDAHSWAKEGPSRLCYSGPVVHSKPKHAMASRTPIMMGAELYGDSTVNSDVEVIHLMLQSIEQADVNHLYLDIGHVGIYQALLNALALSDEAEKALFDAFDRKCAADVDKALNQCGQSAASDMLCGLLHLSGDESILTKARELFKAAPASVLNAIDYLSKVVEQVKVLHPDVILMIDLAELRGYQYHTGLVFAAYLDGEGHAVANGGRYDGIGRLFGRDRPATGFSINVSTLIATIAQQRADEVVLAPPIDQLDDELAALIASLRAEGKRVVHELNEKQASFICQQAIVNANGTWQLSAVDK